MLTKDQVAATAVCLVAATTVLARGGEDAGDRLGGLGVAYAVVMLWRVIARVPAFGLMESMASDYRTADLRIPTALIAWILFLIFAGTAVFAS